MSIGRLIRPICQISLIVLIAAATSSRVSAGDYQQCTTSSTCTIGEYLYDDSYAPLTGASCTLTSKYPDGTTYLSSVAMTGAADGWYKYDASIGTTEGLYHSNICCTPASGTLCIDKTFEVKAPSGSSLTPAAIWGYSDRTLTGYGTLISDIWSYSTRSLTTFGSLVSDVWGYSGRTLTSFGSLVENIWGATPTTLTASASPTSLTGIIAEQKTQRELLEKLVNAPVVTLELEDNNERDLSFKLGESKKHASALYDLVQSSKSRLLTLDEKWSRLSSSTLTTELTGLAQTWTSPAPLSELTVAWNSPIVGQLADQSELTKTNLASLLTSASVHDTSTPPDSLWSAIDSLTKIETLLGDVTSDSSDATLFGYLSSVEEKNTLLEGESKKLASILEDWDSAGETVLSKRVKDTEARLLAINEFPGGESIVEPSNAKARGKDALKNLVFSLQGLIGLNQNLLASSANTPVRGLWLEEGSIIFRAVITNPSKIISQSAPLKFFLPKELKNDDIITIDPDLTATYDTVAETLAVTGTFELKPGATKIVAVEVEDVWQLSDDELIALKTKAEELTSSLKKSNLEGQGIALKSSIVSDIDVLLKIQNDGLKPENRIRAYREARLSLASTQANLTQLENLVAQAGSNSSLLGFVGGVSTTAVFGIVLVIVAGFVFLSIYFKKLGLSPSPSSDLPALSSETEERSELLQPAPMPHLSPLSSLLESKPSPKWQMPAIIAVVVVVTAGSTILLTQAAKPKPTPVINQVIVTSPTPSPSATPTPSSSPQLESSISLLSPQFTLVVPSDSTVNVRNKPSSTADIIMAIGEPQDIYVFKTDGDWRQIGFTPTDSTKGYWVHSKFIEEK